MVGHKRIRWWFAYANQGATPVKEILEKTDFGYEEERMRDKRGMERSWREGGQKLPGGIFFMAVWIETEGLAREGAEIF